MGKTAIILGATGLTGSLLLKKLINDDRYSTIKLFSRKPSGVSSSKIFEFIGDILNLESFKDNFTGDEIFCCIGTTASKTKDKSLYKSIDFGIPYSAAKLAKENNIPTMIVISAIGANSSSSVFYSKTKGEMEEAVISQNIPHTYILQPSLIFGNRSEKRFGETLAEFTLKIFKPILFGRLRKYRAISADRIANTMINIANTGYSDVRIASDIVQKLGK